MRRFQAEVEEVNDDGRMSAKPSGAPAQETNGKRVRVKPDQKVPVVVVVPRSPKQFQAPGTEVAK